MSAPELTPLEEAMKQLAIEAFVNQLCHYQAQLIEIEEIVDYEYSVEAEVGGFA